MAFKFKLTPEAEQVRTTQARTKQRIREDRDKLEVMSAEELANSLEYSLRNTTWHHDLKGKALTYEEALINIYLPELLRRLRGADETVSYDELKRRVVAQKNKT